MILTLKLVGLAFEVNTYYSNQKKKDVAKLHPETIAENSMCIYNLTLSEIFYYGINYIGVLAGPYYKYKTFYDHLYKPFHKYDNYRTHTLKKLNPMVPIYAIIYLFTDYMWPLSYTLSVDFEERSFLYRYWYIWPTFLNFRMRIYIGLTLSECVCTMAGLGVYPTFTKAQAGHGPTSEFVRLKELCEDEAELRSVTYDYETVHNINPYGTEFYPTLRDGMKNWNMTVQYWLATYIYKRFPSKEFRTFATLFVSGVWHGVYSGYYISALMMPFGLIVEDIWFCILLKDELYLPRNVGYLIMLFLKMQYFSYAAVAFCLRDVHMILRYYNSVYHWIIFLYVFLYFSGKYLAKLKKQAMGRKSERSSRVSHVKVH